MTITTSTIDTSTIDTCGLSCPQPVLMVLERITKDAPDTLDVLGDNDASRENITRAAHNRGYDATIEIGQNGVWRLHLRKQCSLSR